MMCYPAGLCCCSRNQAFTIPITCSHGLYAPQVGLKATPTVGLSSHLQGSQKRSHHYKEKPPNNHLTTWTLLVLFVRQDLTPPPPYWPKLTVQPRMILRIPYPLVCTSGHWYRRHIPSAPFRWYWGIKPRTMCMAGKHSSNRATSTHDRLLMSLSVHSWIC